MQELRFHHVGVPTDKKLDDKDYNAKLKLHGAGYFETPYGFEWHNFDTDNTLPDIIKTQPHVAFVVDDLLLAIEGKEVILEPTSPIDDVVVAFILDRGILVELLQFNKPEDEVWPHSGKFVI